MYIKNRMRKTIGSKIKLMAYQFEIVIGISISKGNYKELVFILLASYYNSLSWFHNYW